MAGTLRIQLESKLKDELRLIARKVNIRAYRRLTKEELIDTLLEVEEQTLRSCLDLTWWDRYHGHVYGGLTAIGVLLGVLALLPLVDREPADLRPEVDRTFHPLATLDVHFRFRVDVQHRFHRDYFPVLRDTSLKLADHYRKTGEANLFDGKVMVVGMVRSRQDEPRQPVHVVHFSESPFLPTWEAPSGPAINLISFELRFYNDTEALSKDSFPNPDLLYWVMASTQGIEPTVNITFDLETETFTVSGWVLCETRESTGKLLSFQDLMGKLLVVLHPGLRDDLLLESLSFSSQSGLKYEAQLEDLYVGEMNGRRFYRHQIAERLEE